MDCKSTSSLNILTWTIIGIENIVALLGNGFITMVQGHQWLQKRKILPCDFLLISLSTSRFMMHLLSSVNYILYFISSGSFLNSYEHKNIIITWTFMNMVSLWSATWLSVFYCVKVTNFTNCLFLWLKPRINMLLLRLLGMSIVISSISSLPSAIEYLGQKKEGNLTGTLPLNVSQNEVHNRPLRPVQLAYTSINVCTSVIASTLLLASLWKHTRNLKKSGLGGKDLSTQVHMNVIILLLSYVFFYLAFFIASVIEATNVLKSGIARMLVVDILSTSFPAAHCIVLILTNPKLKEMAARILNIR